MAITTKDLCRNVMEAVQELKNRIAIQAGEDRSVVASTVWRAGVMLRELGENNDPEEEETNQ